MKYQLLENKYLVQTYIRRGLTLVKGKGMYLYDNHGKKYLDFTSNIGVNILGHCHPRLIEIIKSQVEKLINLHGSFSNDQRALASEKLIKITPKNLTRIFWSNSGTESIEAAIKFAFLSSGRRKFIAVENSFHGKTLGALSLMGSNEYREKFNTLINQNIKFIKYNNIDSLKKAIDKNTCALILEPIQGEAGIIPAKKDFLKVARDLCDQNGVILIFDEIQSGMARTGKFLACYHFKVYPDILCLAKGLAGGIPIGATLISEKIHAKIPRKIHTSTFGGNPLATACCLTVLNLIDKKLLMNVSKMGNYFLQQLQLIKSEKIKEVRGVGLMVGVELNYSMTAIVKKMQNLGVLAIPTKSNIIRFLPPLIVKKTHIDQVVKIFEKVLSFNI